MHGIRRLYRCLQIASDSLLGTHTGCSIAYHLGILEFLHKIGLRKMEEMRDLKTLKMNLDDCPSNVVVMPCGDALHSLLVPNDDHTVPFPHTMRRATVVLFHVPHYKCMPS